jgi:MFS family permease
LKRVNAITFLNYMVSGALTLIIPLLLLARNVNLTEIGVVLSVLPLVFLVARLVFAAIADYIGWSHVFLLINWPTTFASTVIYSFASSLPVFFVGKIVEGLRESSYWAVTRTAIFHLSPKGAGNEATKNNAIIWLGTAFGGAIAGIGIAYLGFSSTFSVLALASLAIGIPAVMLWKSSSKIPVPKTQRLFAPLNPKGRSRMFWMVSIAIMFNSLAVYPLIVLLLPVFMNQQLGYDYITIGLLFMVYNAISAAATFLSLKRPLSFHRAIMLTVISVVASFMLAGSGLFFPICLLSLAFVRGYGIGFFEYTVVKVAKDSKNVSIDIGLLHIPMRLAEFASVLAAGFLAQTFGYTPIFVTTGIFFGVYAFLSLHILKTK